MMPGFLVGGVGFCAMAPVTPIRSAPAAQIKRRKLLFFTMALHSRVSTDRRTAWSPRYHTPSTRHNITCARRTACIKNSALQLPALTVWRVDIGVGVVIVRDAAGLIVPLQRLAGET